MRAEILEAERQKSYDAGPRHCGKCLQSGLFTGRDKAPDWDCATRHTFNPVGQLRVLFGLRGAAAHNDGQKDGIVE